MSRGWPLLLFFSALSVLAHTKDPEVEMNAPEVIRYWGYPAEIHNVTTGDGYILQLHRIPHGRRGPDSANSIRPVILLGHGLFCSSSIFTDNLPHQAAAYVFADAGFDVWLANSRGNKYSRRHVRHDPAANEFWDWSWDEMASYDLPAMVAKVLNVTGRPSLNYLGYSQGTLQMFAKLSCDPNFSKKIERFFALAPVGSVAHIWGPMRNYTDWADLIVPFSTGLSAMEVDRQLVADVMCMENTEECIQEVTSFGGAPTDNLNRSRLDVYLGHMPDSTSLRNLLHWAQMALRGTVERYDHGNETVNELRYGSAKPPAYNFTAIHTPVYLFWSPADALADEQDIKGYLLKNLNPEYVKLNKKLDNYNHLDFAFGVNAARDIYKPIIRIIEEGERHTPKDQKNIL